MEITVNITKKALNVLTALTYKSIGKAWVVKNLPKNETQEMTVSLLNQTLKHAQTSINEFQQRKLELSALIEQHADYIDGVVAIGDNDFPVHRGNVKNSQKPVVLFYKGDISLLNHSNKNVAVIGLLQPDNQTEISERKLVDKLVNKGATIVSGLANGCDEIAHKQTLESRGKTVAILPSPLHNILPKGNRHLAKSILSTGGLLVSEYLNDANSKMAFNARYQERDRLQALFSDAIILAASYAKNDSGNDSGARLAMEYAHQYGIARAVMYEESSDASNPKYDLNRQLMRQEPDITVIEEQNIESAVEKILGFGAAQPNSSMQADLF